MLVLRNERGRGPDELHILDVGVTQYEPGADDAGGMVLDYISLHSDTPPINPQPVFHDVVLRPVRGGWRGYLFDYEDDTLVTARTRREAFDAVKASAAGAISARESAEVDAILDRLIAQDEESVDGGVAFYRFDDDVEGFEG